MGSATEAPKPLRLDLGDLVSADAVGFETLGMLRRRGIGLVAVSPYVAMQLEFEQANHARELGTTPARSTRGHAIRQRDGHGGSMRRHAYRLGDGPRGRTSRCSPPAPAQAQPKKPNIVIIWGDDIGQSDISAYSHGLMGFKTPNIDRIAKEGMMFTDIYAEQSCTAGRASFLTGQSGLRTGMTKVGLPASTLGLQKEDPTVAELLKPLGYATGQFGKNHLGDRNEFLPTVHGFDEFYGNLYHLNAEEEPELPDYPKDPAFRAKVRPPRRDGLQGLGDGRPDGGPALRQGRQAGLQGHRPADQGADGDDRRRHRRTGRWTSSSGRRRPASRSSSG